VVEPVDLAGRHDLLFGQHVPGAQGLAVDLRDVDAGPGACDTRRRHRDLCRFSEFRDALRDIAQAPDGSIWLLEDVNRERTDD